MLGALRLRWWPAAHAGSSGHGSQCFLVARKDAPGSLPAWTVDDALPDRPGTLNGWRRRGAKKSRQGGRGFLSQTEDAVTVDIEAHALRPRITRPSSGGPSPATCSFYNTKSRRCEGRSIARQVCREAGPQGEPLISSSRGVHLPSPARSRSGCPQARPLTPERDANIGNPEDSVDILPLSSAPASIATEDLPEVGGITVPKSLRRLQRPMRTRGSRCGAQEAELRLSYSYGCVVLAR